MNAVELLIARRYFRATRKGVLSFISTFAMAGIALGVMALILTIGVMTGFHQELTRRILGINPHVMVTQFFDVPIDRPDTVLALARRLPQVEGADPYVVLKVMIEAGPYTDGIIAKGILPDRVFNRQVLEQSVIMGEFDLSPGKVLLGMGLAARLRVSPGDTVALYSTRDVVRTPLGIVLKSHAFEVAGVFDVGLYDYNANLAFLNLKDAQALGGLGDAVSGVELGLRDPHRAPEVARYLEETLGYPFRAFTWMDVNRSLFSALKLEKLGMFVVLTLIVLVAAFNIVSSLTILGVEKTHEIGILRSMGLEQRQVLRIFTLVGMFMGATGTLIGGGLGLGLAFVADTFRILRLPPDVYFISWIPVEVSWADALLIIGSALLLTFLASLYPALRASRLVPVEAIRNE